MTLSVHVVRPPIGEELDVLHTYERIYRSIDVAAELWRLLDGEEAAKQIESVVASAFEHEPARLETGQIAALLALVEPLDKAIVGPLTDADERLSAEMISMLRGRTDVFDLDEARGEDAHWAVSEAMVGITNLQRILRDALTEGAFLVFE
ncbi:MAG: hypothetical protein M4D80_28995 [Myxococcota bacterium]|nr:hypothetical protein [Deltaproteobacteria bacterium]MDQ3339219.1 hypothetical protein [Myxococcota bacterium]